MGKLDVMDLEEDYNRKYKLLYGRSQRAKESTTGYS
jgi:hypothetical protein